jgi:hypothetical protein
MSGGVLAFGKLLSGRLTDGSLTGNGGLLDLAKAGNVVARSPESLENRETGH